MNVRAKPWAQSTRAWLYPEINFGGYSRYDGTVAFYMRVAALTTPASRVLDLGCGTGAHIMAASGFPRAVQQLRGRVLEVIGADVDERARMNPFIDRFLLIEKDTVPLSAESVDVCVCDWSLEHITRIDHFFDECYRVLRPGGYLCIRTPNALHYSSLGARMIPFRYHHAIRRWLHQFHSPSDVHPTYYRCNSRSRLRAKLHQAGFLPMVYAHRGESHLPGTGRLLGLVGEVIERLSPPLLWHELHAFGSKRATAMLQPAWSSSASGK